MASSLVAAVSGGGGAQKPDIMISYHEVDKDLVKYLTDELKKALFSVWHIDSKDMSNSKALTQKGQMVVGCKIFMMVLSETSVQDQDIRDELALAYVSNKPIYPIGRKWFGKLSNHMQSGMKLMLAKINWTFFVKEEQFAETMTNLIEAIRTEMSALPDGSAPGQDGGEEGEEISDAYELLNKASLYHYNSKEVEGMAGGHKKDDVADKNNACEHGNQINCDFWERHFSGQKEVTWVAFREKFLADYEERITTDYGGEQPRVFVHLIYKDIFDLNKVIPKSAYNAFMGRNSKADPHFFYERLENYAIGNLALREVLNMDSSVRLTAIQNLGTFQTPSVITLLFEFLEDEDPNIRAISGLALSKTGKRSRKIEDRLIKMLQDEDRVVREMACLSLARLKCTRATKCIVDLWRNDAIKHVREAAELALSRIGGEDAENAIKVTSILSQEMTQLRAQAKSK